MKKKTAFFINLASLALVLGLIAIMTDNSIFLPSITGFSFTEFYDPNVLYITGAVANEETIFEVPIRNEKNNEIQEAYAKINIFDKQGRLLKELESEKTRVGPESSKEIKIGYKNNLPAGRYDIVVSIFADESNARFVREMTIKPQTISIESILLTDPETEERRDIGILVENHLDEDIEDAKAKLEIYDEDNKNKISEIIAFKEEINKTSRARFDASWNTINISSGEYPATIKVSAKGYETEKELTIEKKEKEIKILGMGYAINNRAAAKTNDKIGMIIIIAIGVLLFNILIWFVYFKKRN